MAVTFSITRTTTRFHDSNGNGVRDGNETDFDVVDPGVYDPGETLYTRITITNNGDEDATGVTLEDITSGTSPLVNPNDAGDNAWINISPIARNDTFEAIGNTVLRVGAAGTSTINGGESTLFVGSLTSNDIGSLAADDVPGFQIDAVTNGVSVKGGTFNIFADGTFNYVNDGDDTAAELVAGDSFTYTIRDMGMDGVYNTADDLTSTAKVTITFAQQSAGVPQRVWYVDNGAAAGGDGTSANPFQSMAALNGAGNNGATTGDLDQAGEYIYVENTGAAPVSVTGPITLENNQQLIGEGAALVVAGVTLAAAGTNSTLAAASGTIVTLASGNTIAGLNIGNNTGSANGIAGTGIGTLTVNNVAIDAVGSALSLTTGAFAGSGFTTVNSDGGTNNVSFTNITGTVALGGGALTGASGASLNMVSTGAANGLNVTYSGSITQGNNAALVNVDGGTNGHTGTLTLTGTVSATNGTGLQFNNADGTYNFNGTNTLNGGDAGIDILNGSGGTFVFSSNSSITNPSGTAFNVTTGTASIDYNGTISKTGTSDGRVIDIQGHTGGTISFDGLVTASGSGDGVNLVNNQGATINFTGGLSLNTSSSNSAGFVATGASGAGSGGTVNITGTTNTINSGQGTALNITNTNIGANDVRFQSINSSGGTANGIILDTTGTAGGLIVSGTGSAGSGGTIANKTGLDANFATQGTGIYLNNTADVSLSWMQLNDFSNYAIRGKTVTNISMDRMVINGVNGSNTGTDGEGGIYFGGRDIGGSTFSNGVIGDLNFTNSTVGGGFGRNFSLINTSGSLDFIATNNTFAATNSNLSLDNLSVEARGTAQIDALVHDNDFLGSPGDQIEFVNQEGTGTMNVTVTLNTLTNSHPNNNVGGGGVTFATASSMVFNFSNNVMSGANGSAVTLQMAAPLEGNAGTRSFQGTLDNNTIGTNGVLNSGSATGNGIFLSLADNATAPKGTATIAITNNTIQQYAGNAGIYADNTAAGSGAYNVNLTITGNTVRQPVVDASPPFAGIAVTAGAPATSNDIDVFLKIQNNDVRAGDPGNANDIIIGVSGSASSMTLSGATGADVANLAAIQNFIKNQNNLNGAAATTAVTAYSDIDNPGTAGTVEGYIASASSPPLPAAPVQPIMAAAPPAPAAEPVDGGLPGSTETDNGAPPASGPAPAGPVVIEDGILSQAELDFIVDAAIQRWSAAGATDDQIAAMRAVSISVSDLGGLTLGQSGLGTITLDSDAAGWRWFIDSTPGDDSEYAGSGTRLAAVNANGLAGTRIDLLTVITHELGHQIGLSDTYVSGEADELMYGTIGAGERRLPGNDDLAGAADGPVTGAFAFAPITLGTIPAGQKVIVEYRQTIDSPGEDRLVGAWKGQTTLDSDQTNLQTSNAESGNIDGLTLGDRIFNDVNKNGVYDAGDSVLAGVTLRIYGDTNNNNVFDAGDLYVGYNEVGGGAGYQQGIDTPAAPGNGTALTATSDANGIYSFSNLAPGDYIVQIDASNFSAGGALAGYRGVFGGVDPDGSPDVDNDDNGIAGPAGSVVSNAVTLAYDSEPAAGTGNDTNNRLDFGFVLNSAPVANADAVTATEDTEAQYSTQLTGNDTDADLDTLTITAVSNFVNGSGSVTNGVVSFTPTANFNGTASFTYTISDGNGHTASATATVTVGAVNDPVTGTAPATATLNEDAVDFAVTGMSIADADSALAPSGVYQVTLSGTQGTLKLSTITGLTFSTGDGDGDSTMTFSGTLADVNTALATAKYTPNANYNGQAQITLQVTDQFGAAVATGTGAATSDSDQIAVTVNSVNDAPSGTNDSAAVAAGVPYKFTVADFQDGFSDPADGNSFAGVRITELPLVGTLKLNGNAVSVNDVITLDDLAGELFTYDSPANAVGSASFKFAVKDNGGTANGGVEFDQSPDVFTLNIAPANVAPALDLDGAGGDSGFAASYSEGAAAAAISDADVDITDGDSNDDIVSATITISNPEAGDVLNVGSLPSTVTVETNTGTMVKLVAAAGTPASDFELAIKAITYSSTSQDPTDKGTNTSRTINVVVNDGQADSNVAVATITVADDNADAPAGASSTITAVEDAFRLIQASDLGFSDADGTFASVTISAVSGGTLYIDSDGSAGSNEPAVATLPATFNAQDLIDGKASFKAGPNANGTGLGSITFTVTDDDGNVSESSNILTVNVTLANDSPVLTTPGPVSATEQTAVALLPAGSVSDIDLDALNNGDGNYAGAQFSVNRNSAASTDDIFTLVAGPNFTIDGINLKTTGGQIFGQISANNPGLLVVTFNSSQAIATSALVDEVIQAVRYTNASNNPPASVVLAVGFTDGSPNVVQGGAGESHLDVNLLTVNIAGVNDAPVNSLGGTVTIAEDSVDQPLSGMSISDPDANPATDKIYVTFQVQAVGPQGPGLIEIRRDVPGGITNDDVIAEGSDTIQVFATLNQINATLAASNGLTYTPAANFNGDVTLTVYTYDQGKNGSDPGLSGDQNGEEDIDSRTITVTAVNDAAIAKDDSVSTTESAVKTGDLFAPNGSGADTDVEGDPFFVTQITVDGQNYAPGTVIDLPSGAKLTVNSNGTYSYDPNSKFTRLTDGTSGAVNTSATDTFTYTVTGGDTATVTMKVNGVAGPGDWLMGDAGDNTIVGTEESDFFFVSQGGDDDVSGLGSSDGFYFGAELTVDDVVDGGEGLDELALQGDYTGANALTMGDITSVEVLVLLPGNDARFGGAGGDYSYNITTVNENVVGGGILYVDANRLRSNEHLTFNGSAETDGQFFFYGGRGNDTITGGGGADLFLFRGTGKFTAADTLNGGGGIDELTLRGDYAGANKVVFGAATITNIEAIVVVSGHDLRYGANLGDLSYDLTLHNSNVASGQLVIVDGGTLRAGESLMFDGSAEQDGGKFKIFGGQGDDVLRGGTGNDVIRGGLGQDTQTGGGGDDRFVYRSASDSTTDKREGIGDFSTGDIIDLSAIDAKTGVPGEDAFTFIGSGNFTNNAGEVRAFQFAGNIWEVQADIDGDGDADLDFFVTTDHNLVVTDFIL